MRTCSHGRIGLPVQLCRPVLHMAPRSTRTWMSNSDHDVRCIMRLQVLKEDRHIKEAQCKETNLHCLVPWYSLLKGFHTEEGKTIFIEKSTASSVGKSWQRLSSTSRPV